jgi:DNA-binding MarR family transcriptional regulator
MSQSSRTYRFGDLLALARRGWVQQMAARLAAVGYRDYHRTDAAVMRLLLAYAPISIGRLGETLGITRQAARKLADGLQRRGYATATRDTRDLRRVSVRLTPAGESYAAAVVAVIEALNSELCARVAPDQLLAADAVLRAALPDQDGRATAARLVPAPR